MLAENIASIYGTMGVFLAGRNQYDGMVLISGAHDRATEVVNVAAHNKRNFELLERIFAQGDFMKMVVGHGAMIYAILANHDRIPKNPILLQQLGYLPEQLFAKFESAQNASTASSNGHTHYAETTADIPQAEMAAR